MYIRTFCILILLNVISWQKGSAIPQPENVLSHYNTGEVITPASLSAVGKNEVQQGRLNIFVLNRSRRLNMANISIRINSFISRLFQPDIKVITAQSCKDLADKLSSLMKKHPGKKIGHLWLDSHGKYKTGSSIFYIGRDTVGMMNISVTHIREQLGRIAFYCDSDSRITLGSCYSAADYIRPGNGSAADTKMDGDKLLVSVSGLFPGSSVYGSESWIMVKPFMFGRKWGLSGYPLASRYRDIIYQPVWERMGKWKAAGPSSDKAVPIPTPYLTRNGELAFNSKEYLSVKKHRKKLLKKLKRLKPGMYRTDKK